MFGLVIFYFMVQSTTHQWEKVEKHNAIDDILRKYKSNSTYATDLKKLHFFHSFNAHKMKGTGFLQIFGF